MIKIDNITKNFEEVRSLDEVTLAVENSSIFGLIGSNGSGKSTLLRILCGIYKPDSGDILYDGENVWERPDVKREIVYLSDEQFFPPHSTVYDMKRFYASVYPSFSNEKYKTLLDLFGLDEKRKITTFSKGMQKQAQFLIGVACSTRYLFCDETLDGLDPVMRQTVRRIIADEVAESGVTVVFASHNLKEIEDICDHVALLHKGKLLFEAGIDDIKLGVHKVQVSFPKERADEAETKLKEFSALKTERRGSLFTLVIKGEENEISEKLAVLEPSFTEFIPLTLEEIFITEMEEHGYDFDKHLIG